MAYLTKLVLDLISKIMEKTEGGTYDRSTDSNEALSEAIAGLGGAVVSTASATATGTIVEDTTSGASEIHFVASSGSADTFGAWTVLDSSLSADSWICSIITHCLDDTTIRFILEIGIGAGGAEVSIIRFSWEFQYDTTVGVRTPLTYTLPIPKKVVSGTRIAARCSASSGSRTQKVSLQVYQGLET